MPFRRMPSLLSLRAFEAVARHGSFKEAANELSVTAGALSQQVKNLEEELGVELFIRMNRSIRLTEAGGMLSLGLRDAFVQMREAVERVRPRSGNKMLSVSCGPPFAAKWLVPRLHDFSNQVPDVDIQIVSTFKMSDLGPGGVDVAIRFSQSLDLSLHHQFMTSETVMPLVSPDFIERHQLRRPEDLLNVPLLHDQSLNCFSKSPSWSRWFSTVGLDPRAAVQGTRFAAHAEQALDAAASGGGVVLGRKVLAAGDIRAGRLTSPFGPEVPTSLGYYLVCAEEKKDEAHIKAFFDWALAEMQASQSTLEPFAMFERLRAGANAS